MTAPPDPAAKAAWRRWMPALGLILAAALAYFYFRTPPPLLPVPAQLSQLDPQVRAHLTELAKRAAAVPRDGSRRAELGLAFAVNGLWSEAAQSFQDAMALGDRGPLPQLYHAVALQELGDLKGSVRELESLTRAKPNFIPAWHRLGLALLAEGNASAAASVFATLTQKAPDAWQGWAGLGEARLKLGDPASALTALDRAVQLDPFARSARYLRGQALRAVGRTEEAARDLRGGAGETMGPMPDDWSSAALRHMKSLPDQFEQADTLLARGESSLALALLGEALRFHPTNRAVIQRLTSALAASGRPHEAMQFIQPALQREPDQVELLLAAAQAATAAGKTNEAALYVGRALKLAPNLAETQVARAGLALATGADAEAAAALAEALRLAPQNLGLWIQLGDVQWGNLRKPEDAVVSYQNALDLDPFHPVALGKLAGAHLALGKRDRARQSLEELRALAPQFPGLAALEQEVANPPKTP